MFSNLEKITGHLKRQKSWIRMQASKAGSNLVKMIELPDQEFKTTIIMLRGRQYIRKDKQC